MRDPGTTDINIATPDAADLHLRIGVGACRLVIRPGGGEAWVTGTYRDPSGALPAEVLREGATVRITQRGQFAELLGLRHGVPRFDLALGKSKPFMLSIESGASDLDLDLGGVPLTRLVIKQGAGKSHIAFSAPNPQPMTLLNISAGAAAVGVKDLANANAAEVAIDGGAAAYKFDFGGGLQRNAYVRVSTGMSSVELRVPSSTAAKILAETTLGSLDLGDGFTKKEGAFWTMGAIEGKMPALSIQVTVAIGALRLRTA